MLLQRLKEYAESGRVKDLAPSGYKLGAVRYAIHLDELGRFLGSVDGGPKKQSRSIATPHTARSSTAIRPKLLADTGEYALGLARDPAKQLQVDKKHRAFIELVRECALATNEPAVNAVLTFLDSKFDTVGQLQPDFDPSAVITFQVGETMPTNNPEVRAFWANRSVGQQNGEDEEENRKTVASSDDQMQCLICGQVRSAVQRLAYKWQGIPGGQAAGLALISANAKAFESYGLEASLIAPTCANCGELFSKAANDLLANDGTRIRIGPLAYIFWTREEVGFSWATLVTAPDSGQVKALYEAPQRGQSGTVDIDSMPFYAAAFSASGARVVVRDWLDTTIGYARQHLLRYFQLQEIVEWDGSDGPPLPLIALAGGTVRERKDIVAQIPQAILSVALRGGSLPRYILNQVVQRCRAEQRVSREQAALIKMVLLSQSSADRQEQGGRMSQLVRRDVENREPAYLCGRLLAILEEAQRAAQGKVNATIIDRYIGTASSAPASVFGRLLTGAQAHLSTLRRDWPAKEQILQQQLEEAQQGLGTFPRTLTPEKQGLFMLGYYHQRADERARWRNRPKATKDDGSEATDTVQ